MNSNSEIKENVKHKYSQIAKGGITVETVASYCCEEKSKAVINTATKYDETDVAALPEGADLGAGAGINVFIASKYVGVTGKLIGVDMTKEMIAKANQNAKVDGVISDEERCDASLWAVRISGALDRKEYLGIIEKVGFENITVASEKKNDYKLKGDAGLFSITVTGTKKCTVCFKKLPYPLHS